MQDDFGGEQAKYGVSMDGWGWMDGWMLSMDRWMDGWMEGGTKFSTSLSDLPQLVQS